MPDALKYRIRPHPGCSVKWLMCWTTDYDPTQSTPLRAWRANLQSRTPARGAPLCAWMGRATEKDWPKRPSDRQLQEAQKDSNRAITPVAEADLVPAHLVLPGSPQAKKLCYLHAQLSLGQSYHRQKTSWTYKRRVASVLSNSATL